MGIYIRKIENKIQYLWSDNQIIRNINKTAKVKFRKAEDGEVPDNLCLAYNRIENVSIR